MKLTFDRPAVFIDLETTGTSVVTDKIVSIAIMKFKKGFDFLNDSLIAEGIEDFQSLVNPIFPIPAAATAVHGITNEMVKGQPAFAEIANQVLKLINDTIIITYNGNSFDVPLLFAEFDRANKIWDYRQNVFIDACNIFKQKEPRTLAAAYKFYCGEELEGAHNANKDVIATFGVFAAQMLKYEDLPVVPEELALYSNYNKRVLDLAGKFVYNDKDEIVFSFGKHKDKKAAYEIDYLQWILKPTSDFTTDTKNIARRLLNKEL